MRIGVFGGTFDPVHYGHLILAEYCRESCDLDRILFVPASTAPHKNRKASLSAEHRLEMLELAVAGHDGFEISRMEIDRGGLSFTADTLLALSSAESKRDFFLLLGADSFADLPNWKDPITICSRANIVVVARPEVEIDANQLPPGLAESMHGHDRLVTKVEMPMIGISSSELRSRIAQGLSIRYQTPRAVEKYIQSHGLYFDCQSNE